MGSHVHVIFIDMFGDTPVEESRAFCKLRQMAEEDEEKGRASH